MAYCRPTTPTHLPLPLCQLVAADCADCLPAVADCSVCADWCWLPQLYLNYKLKSVAHLPWRQMTYKFLNTIIDDLFAFVIKMPILHRISVFRCVCVRLCAC